MLKERVGIFCTRSPHRPNPIGITLAKIERVDMRKRTVYLSGVDLLDETPVLDIKPYISGTKCERFCRVATVRIDTIMQRMTALLMHSQRAGCRRHNRLSST
jgi:tRNA (Thr-GGU) A37 N-methylase